MNGTRFPSPALSLLTPALLLLSLSPAVAGDPPMVQLAMGSAPSWSPDGDRIVFVSDQSGDRDLWTMLATGLEQTRLTTFSGWDVAPDWSPDGTQIVFTGVRTVPPGGSQWNIYRMPVAGGQAVKLTAGFAYKHGPVWSPDGTQIAFEMDLGSGVNTDIYVMPPSGDPETQLTFDPDNDGACSWSPDGTQIAFSSERGGTRDIWVMPAEGGQATQLTTGPGSEIGPDWSPDGSQIVFASQLDFQHSSALWVMPAAGGPATQLTFPVYPQDDYDPKWSPDGTRIVFSSNRPSGGGVHSIWVLTVPTTGVEPSAAAPIQRLSLAIDPHPVARQPAAVRFELAVAAPIRLALYGSDGRAMTILSTGDHAAGRHRVEWDASGVAPGVYFLRLETAGSTATRKVVVLDR